MSGRLKRLIPVVASALFLCAATARAQDKPVDPKVAAKEHYTRGTSFYDLGRYDDAIKEFEAAYQLKNDPAFLYNLAQSYRQAGNHEQAVHFYKTYLRYVPKAPNRADIEEKIKSEEQLVAKGRRDDDHAAARQHDAAPGEQHATAREHHAAARGQRADRERSAGLDDAAPDYPPPPGYAPPPPGTRTPARRDAPSDLRPQVPHRRHRHRRRGRRDDGARNRRVAPRRFGVERRRERPRNGDSFDPDVQERGNSAETLQWVFYGLGALAAAGGVGLWFYGQQADRRRRDDDLARFVRAHPRPKPGRRHAQDHLLMKRTFISRALLGATLSLVLAAACGYDPNPESGMLKCGSSNTCPDGYSCNSGLCWKNGAGGSSGRGGSRAAAARGAATRPRTSSSAPGASSRRAPA